MNTPNAHWQRVREAGRVKTKLTAEQLFALKQLQTEYLEGRIEAPALVERSRVICPELEPFVPEKKPMENEDWQDDERGNDSDYQATDRIARSRGLTEPVEFRELRGAISPERQSTIDAKLAQIIADCKAAVTAFIDAYHKAAGQGLI